jgi:xanthine dehydrogenase accessory factor
MYNPAPIFEFVMDRQAAGQAVVLVTIATATGGSSRNPGTHLAVAADGSMAGSLTGGCIEAAVAAEALQVLRDGKPRITRYGQGSRYLDIRLPCGGALDLLFSPVAEPGFGQSLVKRLRQRLPYQLQLGLENNRIGFLPGTERFAVTLSASHLTVNHIPQLRCLIFGQGQAIEMLYNLSIAIGMEVKIHSPERMQVSRLANGHLLSSVSALPELVTDLWTATVLMFHDHDWEPAILDELLAGDAFYLGAMGSRKAHAARCAALNQRGRTDVELERISAPIGLIPSMRDPETLAVSALAEIVSRYNQRFLPG